MYQFRRSVLLFSTLFVGIGIGKANSTVLILVAMMLALVSFMHYEDLSYQKKVQKNNAQDIGVSSTLGE